MTITTAYVGEVLEQLYTLLFVGGQVASKGAAAIVTGIAKKKYLPYISQTSRPFGTYTSGQPGSDTVTTTYAERYLEPAKMTLYEDINPDDQLALWKKWQPQGDFTNLANNPDFLFDILMLYETNIGAHVDELFWQGDKSSGTATLAYIDGIITRAIADGNVIDCDASGSGVLTISNIADHLESVWKAIPAEVMDDPNMKLHVSTNTWKLIQLANNKAKAGFTGFMNQTLQDMYNTNKIEHYNKFPDNYILAAVGTPDERSSNLLMGCWVNPEEEEPKIMLKTNAGHIYFVRIDCMMDANYKYGGHMVLYTP